MLQKNINLRFGIIALFIIIAACTRFFLPPNFSPIGAIGLFGAAYFTKKHWAFIIPFAALFLSNLFLNNVVYAAYYDSFQWFGNLWVYLAFGLIIVLGFQLLKKVNTSNLIAASLLASVVFFLITNFSSFLALPGLYPQNFSGLMMAYAAGIPFFWNTLIGDFFFVSVLFGSFELVQQRFPQFRLGTA